MIQYYVSDLIQRAKQISNTENSDYISWKENISVINEIFTKVYNDIINYNQDFNTSTVTLGNGNYLLPNDCYKIKDVTSNGSIINKYNANSSRGGQWYKVTNGVIKLNGCNNVEVTYWKNPPSLTYPANPIRYNLDLPSTKILGNNEEDEIISYIDSDCHLIVRNIDTDKIQLDITLTQDNNPQIVALSKYNVAYVYTDTFGTERYTVRDNFNGNLNGVNGIPVVLLEGLIGIYKDNGIYVAGRRLYDYELINPDTSCIYEDKYHNFNELHSGNYKDKSNVYQVIYNQDSELINTSDGVYLNDEFISPKADAIMGINDKGYGYLFRNKMMSVYKDQIISCPNNLFYNVISYLLAAYYKNKVGDDPSAVMMELERVNETFYKSLKMDNNQFVTIKNVYV